MCLFNCIQTSHVHISHSTTFDKHYTTTTKTMEKLLLRRRERPGSWNVDGEESWIRPITVAVRPLSTTPHNVAWALEHLCHFQSLVVLKIEVVERRITIRVNDGTFRRRRSRRHGIHCITMSCDCQRCWYDFVIKDVTVKQVILKYNRYKQNQHCHWACVRTKWGHYEYSLWTDRLYS